jgi:hypothetical protein
MSRERREDLVTARRMRTAALLFAAAMVMVGGSLAWTVLAARGKEGEAGAAP